MHNEPTRRERRRDALLAALTAFAGKPAGLEQLLAKAGLHAGEQTEAKRVLRELVEDGQAARDGKRWSLVGAVPPPRPGAGLPAAAAPGRAGRTGGKGIVGTLTRHRDGFGFVARLDRDGEDVFLPPGEATRALDGDLVRVEEVPGRGGRMAGRLLEVVERRRRLLIGTYHARGRTSFVVPADLALGGQVPVPESGAARDGDVVKVALAPGTGDLAGEVVESIGRPGEPRVEVLSVAYAKGFADVFPDATLAEAARVPDHVTPADRAGRRDLTTLPLVTIDGEDARDFDDAVFVERLPRGKGGAAWRLVVAIADVTHYVRPGSALDTEALRRGTSAYFPMQVLPMLPERLSNGICSLNPDVERLCLVADMTIDARGEPKGAEVYRAVMRSAARCTYTEVARVLDGEVVPGREPFRAQFELMGELQAELTAMRRRRGAIDFDLPEAKIILDGDGLVAGIEKRPRNRAHRVVEEFMLAANEAVARWFGDRDLPTIYRVHGVPDEQKLQLFLDLAASHGFPVPELPVDPRALDALLTRLKGHPQQRALNQLLLRSMMQALYSAENQGHFGLAASHYLHFTSPIRRYPDLMVHRLLEEEWARREGRPPARPSSRGLEEVAARCSERERASMEAEREIASYYAALFMKDKIGQRYPGTVAAVAEPGLFVELGPFFVEGMVRAEDLPGEFELDPVHHAMVDRRTGRAFRVGDVVEVEVANASPARRRVELLLTSAAPEAPEGFVEDLDRPPRPAGRGGARPGTGGRGGERGAGGPGPGRSLKDAVRAARGGSAGSGGGKSSAQGGRKAKGARPGAPSGSSRPKPGRGSRPGRRGR
ncbi:MAG: ribonuclease R [Anaeromyxobacter sp.]|nr:ribonuclease R [Anaeromyxobacter sp.]MBL0274739.1 ribonuclease R [Anaeromyxobacter sp.]